MDPNDLFSDLYLIVMVASAGRIYSLNMLASSRVSLSDRPNPRKKRGVEQILSAATLSRPLNGVPIQFPYG